MSGMYGTTTITGLVLHATTGNPVVEAEVIITMFRAVTDSDGRYLFEIPMESLPDGKYTLSAGQVGMLPSNKTILVHPGRLIAQDFALVPKS